MNKNEINYEDLSSDLNFLGNGIFVDEDNETFSLYKTMHLP